MRESINRRSFLKLTGSSVVVLTAGNATAEASRDELRQAAKEDVANDTGFEPSSLTVATDTKATYPVIEERYYRAKILDPEHRIHESALDGDTEPVDLDAVRDRERDAYRDKYGRLTRDLADRVADAADGETIRVGVWHTGPDRAAAREAVDFDDRDLTAQLREDLSAEFRARISSASEDLADEISATPGANVEEVGAGESRVGATATPSAVEEIETFDDVRKVTLAEYPDVVPDLKESAKTHEVWDERNGAYNADGYTVGVFGADGIPDKQDLDIDDSTTYGSYSGAPKDAHADRCALAAASTDDTQPGTAHDATVSATYDPETDLDDKMTWFSFQDAPVNCSWSVPYDDRQFHDLDTRFNQFVMNNFQTIVNSAGNQGSAGYKITTPGRAMNVLTVGAADNQDSGYDPDDEWASYSCFKEPISRHTFLDWSLSDIKKPDVSAVGSPTAVPGDSATYQGTSYAASHVTGLATLMNKFGDDVGDPLLTRSPELVKAIAMVGATNVGDAGSYARNKMGTGIIDASETEKVIKNGWYEFVPITSNWIGATRTFYAEAGDIVRIAVTWLANELHPSFWDYLGLRSDVDLDVFVSTPSGGIADLSLGWGGTSEFLEFEAHETGDYEVQIVNFSYGGSNSTRVASLAWNRW